MPHEYARYYICNRSNTWAVYRDHHGITTIGEDLVSLDVAYELALEDGTAKGHAFRIYRANADGVLDRLYDSVGK